MENAKVHVIGELNPDLILSGLRKFPAPGEETLAKDLNLTLGSSSAIFAVALSRLGIKVEMASRVGADFFGDFTIKGLEENGVGTGKIIVDREIRTGITVSLSTPEDRSFVTFLGSISQLNINDIDISYFLNFKHLHISSYFLLKGLKKDIPYIFEIAKKCGLTTSLDTGFDPDNMWEMNLKKVLPNVDIFLPNNIEALRIQKKTGVEEAVKFLGNYCENVVVKLGEEGAVSYSKDGLISVGAFKVKSIDTTGAGDNFNAGFIYGFLNGFGARKCLEIANACGAISTTKIGGTTASPGLKELKNFLKKHHLKTNRFDN
ncbi:MAG: carbohydrate kinase family protein [Actinobacteria bacterium]|nr:carbohydrate kinase family protein [Actinomycetota bacterium]